MSHYGQAAVEAVELISKGETRRPRQAWENATCVHYERGSWSQRKDCPRSAFLGLCEEGLVKGIQKGKYTRSKMSKAYAVDAVKLLKKFPDLAKNSTALWIKVMGPYHKKHNQQMDVVLGLWTKNLIIN